MRCIWPFLVFAILLLVFPSIPCAQEKGKSSKEPPDVIFVAEDDKEMNAAMEKARKTVDDFIKVFQNRKKGQSGFGVKVTIKDDKKVEHFWVEITSYSDKKFEGTISNDPALVTNVKAGDKIKVDRDKIGDWMYVEKNKLFGGYTVRVLRNRLSPEERKALDESIPYKIE